LLQKAFYFWKTPARGGKMKKNVGGFDKILRIIAGVALVIAGIFAPVGMGWRIGSFAVAGVAFVTGFVGF
jgi:uncharacterized membrane protein